MITYKVKGVEQLVQTLKLYKEKNIKKTFPEICNAKALDVAYRAITATQRANISEISNLELRSWWPKYVAKRLANQGVAVAKKTGALTRAIFGNKKYKTLVKGTFTKEEAKKASKAIIASRKRSVSFVASGWLGAIKDLKRFVPRKEQNKGGVNAKRRGEYKGYGLGAASIIKTVSVAANTALSPKHLKQPFRILAIARAGAELALAATVADMKEYIARKMKESAKESGVIK